MIHHEAVHSPKRCDCRRNQRMPVLGRGKLLTNGSADILAAALVNQRFGLCFGRAVAEYHPRSGSPKHPHRSCANPA